MDNPEIKKLRYVKEKITNTYGMFTVEPLEQGFGTTLGNALRRVLLSSLEGAAITSVRIEGVLHEFSGLPGVVEDTTDLILNLKEVRLKLHTDSAEARIKAKGAQDVKAGDIEGDVEIMNPDLHIATLDSGGKLSIEMNVRLGRGYLPAEKNKEPGQPIGIISLDAAFSPVRKVNFRVENARVGQRTDYDKLVLEVTTDGSIRPDEALGRAARLFQDHLKIFISREEEIAEPVEEEVREERFNENLLKCVSEIELSIRASNGLMNAGIKTIAELVQKSEAELLRTRNFGRKTMDEIKEVLAEMGLGLGMMVDESIVATARRCLEERPAA